MIVVKAKLAGDKRRRVPNGDKTFSSVITVTGDRYSFSVVSPAQLAFSG